MISPLPVIVVGPDLPSATSLVRDLEANQVAASPRVGVVGGEPCVDEETAVAVVLAGGDDDWNQAMSAQARARRVPVIGVISARESAHAVAEAARVFDDWVVAPAGGVELAARVLRAAADGARRKAIDPRFLALTVHDLRTPLNVIGLTIRAISQSVPEKTPDFEEDLVFLQENARQIERMLAQLGDYCRLLENESPPQGVEFDMCRFLRDFVEDRGSRQGASGPPVVLELGRTCPREVSLDPNRTRMALQHALANASTAAGTSPVRLELMGEGDRVRIEISVDRPPPSTVVSTALRPDLFERLAGSAAERRGLDLAITARISERFGGSARLEVDPGRRSTVVLDWPARISPNPAPGA